MLPDSEFNYPFGFGVRTREATRGQLIGDLGDSDRVWPRYSNGAIEYVNLNTDFVLLGIKRSSNTQKTS